MISWDESTDVLLNPRLPPADAERIRGLIARAPRLSAHVWFVTSGSSGAPKPVALSKAALLASADAVNAHLASDARDVWCTVLPTFHVGGLGIYARARRSGARVVALDGWDPAAYVAAIARERATLSALVPTQVFDLVSRSLHAPASLRAVVIGGAALRDSLYSAGRALGWPLLPSYGSTECASQAATATLDSLASETFPPLVRLSHLAVRAESDGRLALKGASLFAGYATESGFDDPKRDGWWITEDLGAVDGDHVRVLGRRGEIVKVGGESVSIPRLQEVLEMVALAAGTVGKSIVVAMPDDRLGSAVHLVTEAASADDATRLFDTFNQRVLPFERARALHRLRTIPRSPLGKVLWEKLRDALTRKE